VLGLEILSVLVVLISLSQFVRKPMQLTFKPFTFKPSVASMLKPLKQAVLLLAIALFCTSCSGSHLPPLGYNPWDVIALPTKETLTDIAFASDRLHGWVVGRNSTLLTTDDGGTTWEPRVLELNKGSDSKFSYAFNAVSFSGDEGWILGQPSILLHTKDGGKSWSEIPLSAKLPGLPYSIVALGPSSAELVTDVGAIYKTADGGQNWQALVQEAVGVSRNIERSPDGKYVAVSARGSFYSTWEPGQTAWQPYNRNSSRRLQNMGFSKDGNLWLLARGGVIQFGQMGGEDKDWTKERSPEKNNSWGLLDIEYRTANEVWLTGGSGSLLVSHDNGETWERDVALEDVPANLYKIVFLDDNNGFILGNNGTLLRYNPSVAQAA
jgi:photosystem II stability/assembly factor-like uncharacterized protein